MGAIFKAWVWRRAWRAGRAGPGPLLVFHVERHPGRGAVWRHFRFADNYSPTSNNPEHARADLASIAASHFTAEDEIVFAQGRQTARS